MIAPGSIVAAFDVDGTLTDRDCVSPFVQRLRGRTRLAAGVAAQPWSVVSAAWRRDRDRFKAVVVRAALAGREAVAVERLGAAFAELVHERWMRADTTRRLAWHQTNGHRVVLVSASLGAYLRPLGQRLGVDGVICTEAEIGPDGRYTGELIGPNCRGPEKVRRLRAWMTEMNLEQAELWAYGDSAGDREMLAAAHRRLLVKGIDVPSEPDLRSC